MKEIHIIPVLNGFIVQVGCTQVVFNNIDHLCAELKRYQQNPSQVEEEYVKYATNKLAQPIVSTGPSSSELVEARIRDIRTR